ncbi:adenine methyltransferase [Brevibacillus sp. NSP2.1]|uniref:DNA N-6-adenine-methyltransferase n=1 Tax=Brevibacillus sp. NSP2.1 TaxID=3003229 RepID=UPI0009D71C61|nr:DNA N-6-adenine-methyltransferase [Brevibacillus sp. NSP2.1]QHZ55797.1 adenine methyltransferase [Brevibacillus sp. NSP2.1]
MIKTSDNIINKAMFKSEREEWETPQEFFDKLNDEFGFQLDVCALPTNAKCERYFTPDDDGLHQEWTGVCWMNPPYGREIGKWVKKAYESAKQGATVVCLLPARTDVKWWHDYCMKAEIRLVRGRMKFVGADNMAPFPNAVVIFSPASAGCSYKAIDK